MGISTPKTIATIITKTMDAAEITITNAMIELRSLGLGTFKG
jgi:hypothetical protein